MIEVPKAAIDLAKRFEGFERKAKRGVEITAIPYICPAGYWTIGFGHLCDPKHPPITEVEAEVFLARDLQTALAATPALLSGASNRAGRTACSHCGLHVQLGSRAATNLDIASAYQSTGLAGSRARVQAMGARWRENSAWACGEARSRSDATSRVVGIDRMPAVYEPGGRGDGRHGWQLASGRVARSRSIQYNYKFGRQQ